MLEIYQRMNLLQRLPFRSNKLQLFRPSPSVYNTGWIYIARLGHKENARGGLDLVFYRGGEDTILDFSHQLVSLLR